MRHGLGQVRGGFTKTAKKRHMAIRISPLVAVMMGILLIFDRSGVCFLTLAAAFLHELGHLLAARLLKIPLGHLQLDFLGARMEVRGRMLSYGEEWLLSAAGPMTSLLAAAGGAVFWSLSEAAGIFSCASLVLGLLNLLPIRTFDGGRMLECSLSPLLGEARTQRLMRLCSLLFLLLLWASAVYFLLRAGDGLSLFGFSVSLLLRFFDGEKL